jgi:hypothetical protein
MKSVPPKVQFTLVSVILGGIVVGCAATVPKEALELSPENLRLRQLQTRRFDSKDEKALLTAGAAVLQDLGFTLENSEPGLGVIVASKDRSAVEAGQVMAAIFMALLGAPMPIDKNQKIRASLVSRPAGEGKESTLVRVTFQRIVWNTEGRVTKAEPLDELEFYQEFFSQLSKAVFLDAHEL